MQRHTILVVDDEPASLRSLQRTLKPHYEVLAADGAEAGLAMLAAQPVSLIVTDHRMPGLTGVEMLGRSRVSHPDTVRLVLTGYADVEAVIEAINDGAVFYYLTKPWEPPELLLAVRRGLDGLEAEWQRRALLRDLRQARDRAEREAEQKTRLLATAAHELGTPIHLLGNAVELLSDAAPGQWIDIASRSLAWLRRSLAQMHCGFRLRSGQLRLARTSVDLATSLGSVIEALRRAAAERRLDLRLEAPAGVRLDGDPEWLRQLWICLLSNAVRFTPDGGAVAVRAGASDGEALVRFTDDGVGMRPEQLAAAFEAFSVAAGDLLLHGSGRLEFGARGLGLGLSIARDLVALHQGRIEIASELGAGTEVRVWLPLLESAP